MGETNEGTTLARGDMEREGAEVKRFSDALKAETKRKTAGGETTGRGRCGRGREEEDEGAGGVGSTGRDRGGGASGRERVEVRLTVGPHRAATQRGGERKWASGKSPWAEREDVGPRGKGILFL